MAIFRGDGGAGDSTTDATLSLVTAQAVIATTKASESASSAVNADGSKTAAATSATSATASASAASAAASGVTASATAAAASATAAAASSTSATTAKNNAETAETNAETAETNAETAETNAAASAATGTTKAAEAATSAATASTGASTATTKASEASASASAASTSEGNASTSATGAASSASGATSSASAAASSATASANSATAAASSAASIGTDPSFNSVTVTGSTAVKMPVGTTAERPTPVTGQLRYNSTLAAFEGYTTEWGEIGGGGGGSADISLNSFTGDGSDLTFSLSAVAAENNTFVYIDGVYQNKATYAVSAADPAVVTFSTAPPNGTAIEIMSAAISVTSVGVPSDNSITTAKIVDGAVTTAKIVDGAVTTAKIVDGAITAAKLAAGAGGVGPEYISATPTLSSSAVNEIVIGNYSSYASPTFNTKVGSTFFLNTDNAGTLTLAAPFSLGGTQTVVVEGVSAGKLHSTSATVSVVLPSLTARYWRITNQVAASASISQPPTLDGWQLFSSLNGGGTQRGSTTALTASQNQAGRYLSNVFLNNGNYNWYPYQYSGLVGDLWIVYDLGSPQEVLSMKWQNPGSGIYYATSWTLQNSSDNTNWVDIKYITQTASEATLRTINL